MLCRKCKPSRCTASSVSMFRYSLEHRQVTTGMERLLKILTGQRVYAFYCYGLLTLTLCISTYTFAHNGIDHVAQDANAAKLAQSYTPFEVDPALVNVPLQTDFDIYGSWGPVISWPQIPVSAANLADGRVLTWASNQADNFQLNGPEYTHASVWDPSDNSFIDVSHPGHDMFCAHQVMLEDGRVFVNGGRSHSPLTSVFDSETDTWTVMENMSFGRWYPTTIALSDGSVLTALGGSGGQYPELWESGLGWKLMTGIDLTAPILSFTSYWEQDWWPYLTVKPDGDLLHYGPTPDMHTVNTSGVGSISGEGVLTTDWYPKNGAHTVYDEGKIIVTGGGISESIRASTNKALVIDFNGPNPIVTTIAPMTHPRRFHNAIVLANGEVLFVGGNTSGIQFDDTGTVLTPEIWNPATQTFRDMADISVPRNYHSIALLLVDGRVLSAGGGLCGCPADHQDAQVFSPPYLYNADGTLAPRPVITSAPGAINNGQAFNVTATAGMQRFTMIKLSSTTHANNTDLRFLNVPFTEMSSGQYDLTSHANENVLTPGYYFLFAINAQGVPSIAEIVQVNAGASPPNYPGTLTPVQDQFHAIGDTVSLAPGVHDIDGPPFTWTATGLPPGLTIDTSTGIISGLPTAVGTWNVNVSVTDGNAGAPLATNFNWYISLAGDGMGSILREWWLNVGGSHIVSLTGDQTFPGDPDYPHNPDGSELLSGLVGPTNWADSYGARLRGYIHPPISGNYTFWIAADDEAQLFLSTDTDPANATMIADVYRSQPQEWDAFPSQQSQAVNLLQGQAYYVEVLHKENAAVLPDHVAISWQIPGTPGQPVVTGSYLTPWGYDPNNRSPSVDNPGTQLNVLNDIINLTVQATDPDGDTLSWSATGLPAGLSLDPVSGIVSGTITALGTYNVTVTADDGNGRSDDALFDWQVNTAPANNPPVIDTPVYQLNNTGDSIGLQITATDPEGDTLAWSATGLPDGLSIDSVSGLITGTPTMVALFTPVVYADDGNGNIANKGFLWDINPQPLTVSPIVATPVEVGTQVDYTAVSQSGQNPQYKWNFGDGTPETAYSSATTASHIYANPGRYIVTLTVTESGGSTVPVTFVQAVHHPPTVGQPAASTTIIYETRTGNDRIWNVNPDNDTVSVFDIVTFNKLAEPWVGDRPSSLAIAPDGRVWVVNRDSHSISIINPDTFVVEHIVALPVATQPHGLVFDPLGAHAWVTLETGGEMLQLSAADGSQTGSVTVGMNVRHLSVSADGSTVYVSRFITPPVPGEDTAAPQIDGTQAIGGEVLVIDTASLTVSSTVHLRHSDLPDAANAGRGLPNYLGAAVISPDGTKAWVPSKQDNIKRGTLRDNTPLTHDSTVRSITSRIDLLTGSEDTAARIDHDDGGIASATLFGPNGNYLYVALEGSREVSMRDVFSGIEVMRIIAGRAPQGLARSPDGKTLYVNNFMDRSVTVHDLTDVQTTPATSVTLVNTLNTVANESLAANVLTGKQHFYDSRDGRIALQGYISCAACHNDGGTDGRTWDFTGFGEGLRNTIDLRGHAGTAQGPLHWSGNFDEVHDFEGQIRTLALGGGLMNDTEFNTGTTSLPLGDPKAGLSADLDALSAYVGSLNTYARSPYRNTDGTRTPAGTSGQSVFLVSNCASCHSGAQYTDSVLNNLHDIGTLKPSSGNRLGAALTGIDTPTLRGIWATPPYLHDGSAAMLGDAVSSHTGVSLSANELDFLVSYLQQIDNLEQAPLDSDSDGLADDLETSMGTDAFSADTDGDGLGDYLEVSYDGDPGSYVAGSDLNPNTQDSDGDGISDIDDYLPLTFNAADGDLAPLGAPDGLVNAADLLIAMRILQGQLAPTNLELLHGDLYPPSVPDGAINLSDYLLILQIVLP